jgi:hypothetical protein
MNVKYRLPALIMYILYVTPAPALCGGEMPCIFFESALAQPMLQTQEFPHLVLSRDTGAHTPSGPRLYGPNKNKLTGV